MDSSATTLWTSLFPKTGSLVSFYHYYVFIDIPVFNANRVDPDQMPHDVASDMGLHCLSLTLFIPRHTIVAGYYGFMLDVRMSIHPSIFHFRMIT